MYIRNQKKMEGRRKADCKEIVNNASGAVLFIFCLFFRCSIRPYLEKFTYEGDIFMKEKKKSCMFNFLIPVISLVLFALIRRNVKGNGAKAE